MANNQNFAYGILQFLHGMLANDFEYGIYTNYVLAKANTPPPIVTVISPISGKRNPSTPAFIFTTAPDAEGESLHFKIDISNQSSFDPILATADSRSSQTGWSYQVSTDDGATYGSSIPLPPTGIPSVAGHLYKVTFQSYASLANGTYYWRALGHDGQNYSISYTTNAMKIGDKITVTLAQPVDTGSVNARAIIAVSGNLLPTDGVVPASIKVFATNNGFDASPTWEDITTAVLTRNSYAFTNTTKTAGKFGVNIRIEITANDSIGAIEQYGFAFKFA